MAGALITDKHINNIQIFTALNFAQGVALFEC